MQAYLLTHRRKLRLQCIVWVVELSLASLFHLTAADTSNMAADLLRQAKTAFSNGKHAEAVSLASQAIEKVPTNAAAYFVRGSILAGNHESEKALIDFDQALKLDPALADAWQHRGVEHFKLGHIKESIADFDQFIALRPASAPYHWQRGIAYYYAARFEEGRKQFELHQTVNSNDVENAVWHFLCVARSAGLEQARTVLIPIKGDARVPMMEVHALFAGKTKPEDVIKAARAGQPSEPELHRRLFYAHLYLGLYFEALNDPTRSLENITKAAGQFRTDDYMGDVARVHLQLRNNEARGKARSAN
jgi:lipoprotein NlpI